MRANVCEVEKVRINSLIYPFLMQRSKNVFFFSAVQPAIRSEFMREDRYVG